MTSVEASAESAQLVADLMPLLADGRPQVRVSPCVWLLRSGGGVSMHAISHIAGTNHEFMPISRIASMRRRRRHVWARAQIRRVAVNHVLRMVLTGNPDYRMALRDSDVIRVLCRLIGDATVGVLAGAGVPGRACGVCGRTRMCGGKFGFEYLLASVYIICASVRPVCKCPCVPKLTHAHRLAECVPAGWVMTT